MNKEAKPLPWRSLVRAGDDCSPCVWLKWFGYPPYIHRRRSVDSKYSTTEYENAAAAAEMRERGINRFWSSWSKQSVWEFKNPTMVRVDYHGI